MAKGHQQKQFVTLMKKYKTTAFRIAEQAISTFAQVPLIKNPPLQKRVFMYCSIRLIQTPKVHRHQLAHTGFLHGNAINHVHAAHGHFVVRNNDELALLAELADHLGEFAHVGIIQRGVHFVQNTEGGWFDEIDGKQQGRSR